MHELEALAKDFLTDEGMSLRNALAFGGMGLAKTTGHASEIISGVGFSEQQYGPERQSRMAEILGEMLFHWHILASTLEIPYEEIIGQYLSAYEATRRTIHKDKGITLQDMMEMRKHVKSPISNEVDIKRELDWMEKKKQRTHLLKIDT